MLKKFRAPLIAVGLMCALPAQAELSLTSDRFSVVAGNATAQLRIERDVLPGLDSQIRYRTVEGSALAGRDFVSQVQTVSLPAGVRGVDIEIPLLSASSAQTRSFAVELSTVSGERVFRFTRADVQIVSSQEARNESGVVRIPIARESLTVPIRTLATYSREGGARGEIRIRVRSRPGFDFQPVDRTLTWADGETGTRTVEVVANIPYSQRTQPIQVFLDAQILDGPPLQIPAFEAIFLDEASIDTVGKPAPEVAFYQPEVTYGADAQSISTVFLPLEFNPETDGGLPTYSYSARSLNAIPLKVEIEPLTGEENSLVTSESTGRVEVDAFSFNGMLRVTFVDGPLAEDRVVELQLSSPVGVIARQVITVLGTSNDPLYDNSAPSNFGTVSVLRAEDFFAPDVEELRTVVLRSGNGALEARTVQYEFVGLSDENGADIEPAMRSGSLSWAPGETGAKPVSAPLLRTNLTQTRQFELIVRNLNGVILERQTLTVLGFEERFGQVGFLSDVRDVPYDVTTVLTYVERTGSDLGPGLVQYRIFDGSAAAGRDFAAEDAVGTLEWEAGETGVKPLLIPLIPRLTFAPRTLTIDIAGPGVVVGGGQQTVRLAPTPLSAELNGRVGFERDFIRANLDELQVSANVFREGGSIGDAIAQVLVRRPDGTVRDSLATWDDGDNDPVSLVLQLDQVGEYRLSLGNITGAVGGTDELVILVEGNSSGGGGAVGFGLLACLALVGGLRRRERHCL